MQQLFPGVYSLEGEIGGRPLQGFEALMCCRYDVYREDHGIFYDGDAWHGCAKKEMTPRRKSARQPGRSWAIGHEKPISNLSLPLRACIDLPCMAVCHLLEHKLVTVRQS